MSSYREARIRDLERELERLKTMPDVLLVMLPIEQRNWQPVVDLCLERVLEVQRGDTDTDTKDYLYEAAMEAVFGKSIWPFLRSLDGA